MDQTRSTPAPGVASHHLRRRWAGIASVLVVSVFAAGLIAAVALRMKQHETVLDRRGQEITAVVTATTDGVSRKRRDFVEVRYEVDGRQYEPRLPVHDSTDVSVGSEIRVVYDRDNPRHAKPTERWAPAYETALIWAVGAFGLGVADSARRSFRTLRLLQTARRPRHRSTMQAESFSLRRWWQVRPRQWVALWPLEANPTIAEPEFYVPIEELDGRRALHLRPPSLVLGMLESRRLVVVVQGEQVVWPRGRARRDEPGGGLGEIV